MLTTRKGYLAPIKHVCSLCSADARRLLLKRGVLTVPVEVFDYSLDITATLTRAVRARCAGEVAAAHPALVEELPTAS